MRWAAFLLGGLWLLPTAVAAAQSAAALGAPEPTGMPAPAPTATPAPEPTGTPAAGTAPAPEPSATSAPSTRAAGHPGPEIASGLSAPRPGVAPHPWPLSHRPHPHARRHPPAPPTPPWDGPRVELGWAHYDMTDGYGGGTVNALDFGGYLPIHALRLGGWVELGERGYRLGPGDALVRGNLIVGYQYLHRLAPLVPYAGFVTTFGIVLGKRFHTPVSYAFGGAGIEVGADFDLVRTLWVGASFDWIRATMQGLAYDLWTLRLRIGL